MQSLLSNPEIRNYYVVDSNTTLRASMHDLIDDHKVVPYTSSSRDDVWDALKYLFKDSSNTDNVILAYSRRSHPKSESGLTSGWNREHLWCNSYGLDSQEPAYSDLFNLMPADWNVNSSRGNNFFDNSDPLDSSYNEPGFSEAPLTSRDSDSWEPPDEIKGDVARATFYMDLRYEGNASDEVDLIITDDISLITTDNTRFGKLSTLIEWHQEDPVSEEERTRNQLIAENYQQNRNPFIDFPELVLALHDSTNHSLVFLTASYYTDNSSIDVTNLLNENVSNGRINMTIGNHTMGGDPEWGVVKSFYALVAYEGKIFNLNLFEGDQINIPDNLDNGGSLSGEGSRSIIWNDTDLFYSKSFTQQDIDASVFRSYDLLLKSRGNFSSQVQTLNLPDVSSLSSITNEQFVKEGSHYIFEHSFASNADLFSYYPSGEYNWNIGSSNGSNYVEHTLNTNEVEYPTITPSVIGGKWEGGKLLVDPLNPVIRVSQWSGSDANDRLEWGYWTASRGAGGASSSPGGSTIDFGWLSPIEGQDYLVYLFYVDVLSEQQNTDLRGDRYNARFGAVSALYFTMTLSTRGSEPTLSEILADPSSFGLVSQSDAYASERAAFERGYIQGFYDGNLSVIQNQDSNATPYTPSWFYMPDRGWMWSQKDVYPWFYDKKSSNWMYFQSGHENPRFYHYGTKEWMTLE